MSAFTKAVLNKLSQFSANLEARLDKQDAKIDAFLKAASPPSPEAFVPWVRPQIDLLRHAAPAPSAEVIAAGAVMNDVVADNRKGGNIHQPRSMLAPTQTAPAAEVKRGSGWRDEQALRPPPGISQLDKIMDEQDRRDREDLLARSVARAKHAKDLPKPKRPEAKLDTADLDAIMGDKPAAGGR